MASEPEQDAEGTGGEEADGAATAPGSSPAPDAPAIATGRPGTQTLKCEVGDDGEGSVHVGLHSERVAEVQTIPPGPVTWHEFTVGITRVVVTDRPPNTTVAVAVVPK